MSEVTKLKCPHDGTKLSKKTVSKEYAEHLNKTAGLPVKQTYDYCDHCGIYFVGEVSS